MKGETTVSGGFEVRGPSVTVACNQVFPQFKVPSFPKRKDGFAGSVLMWKWSLYVYVCAQSGMSANVSFAH